MRRFNAKMVPWSLDGRPAHEWLRENFYRLRPLVEERIGLRATS